MSEDTQQVDVTFVVVGTRLRPSGRIAGSVTLEVPTRVAQINAHESTNGIQLDDLSDDEIDDATNVIYMKLLAALQLPVWMEIDNFEVFCAD